MFVKSLTGYIADVAGTYDVFGSRDLYKFWEISDNISETVQERET